MADQKKEYPDRYVWQDEDGKLHADAAPAVVYKDNGEKWLVHGKLHRVDGPAKITRHGYPVNFEKWFFEGRLHRMDGPAVIGDDGSKKWYINGQLHREDGPAIIHADGSQEYFIHGRHHRQGNPAIISSYVEVWAENGKLHRIDGPAVKYFDKWDKSKAYIKIPFSNYSERTLLFNAAEAWLKKGKFFRKDGPSITRKDGTQLYVEGCKLHREDGPAVIYPHGSKEWWTQNKLHRENGPAIEVEPNHFIFYMQRPFEADHKLAKRFSRENAISRRAATEHPMEEKDSVSETSSMSGNKKTVYYNYKYRGRGVRILSNQYWQKGKFIQKVPVPETLAEFEDPENKTSILVAKHTFNDTREH